MKSEKKVLIVSALNALQERDPDWKQPAMIKKFKILYDDWRQKELRAKQHAASFYTLSWKRGWLSQATTVGEISNNRSIRTIDSRKAATVRISAISPT